MTGGSVGRLICIYRERFLLAGIMKAVGSTNPVEDSQN